MARKTIRPRGKEEMFMVLGDGNIVLGKGDGQKYPIFKKYIPLINEKTGT